MHDTYSALVKAGKKATLIAALAQADPTISDMEIQTERGEPYLAVVTNTATDTNASTGVPLALQGDGVRWLARITMELSLLDSPLVLIEEPEAHVHPRAMQGVARAVWGAVRRGIQIVASTHSVEFIDDLIRESSADEVSRYLTVQRIQLESGVLRATRVPGAEVAKSRVDFQEDLR